MRRLGIDIGRVLIRPGTGREDTSFFGGSEEDALRTPPVDGAFDAVRALVEWFEGRVWLVSKAGTAIEARTRRWLDHWRLHEHARLPREHVRFCRTRPEKRDIALELGLTHFIDDRRDVLEHLRGVVGVLYLFGPQRAEPPSWVVWVPDWDAVLARARNP